MTVGSVILSGIYTLLGFTAALAFFILGNYPSALWGTATGLISLQIFHIQFLEYRQQLDISYTNRDIKYLFYVGALCSILSGIGFLVHIIFEIITKKGVTPVGSSEIISIIWSFMALKVSSILAFLSKRYTRDFSSDFIVSENVEASS